MMKANRDVNIMITDFESHDNTQSLPESEKSYSEKKLVLEYDRSIKIKDKLEDKAKSSIIGLTISITLIMGASGIVSNAVMVQPFIWLSMVIIFLYIIAVIYMMIAGFLALQLLMDKNKVYFTSVDIEDVRNCAEAKIECYKATQLNDMSNQIRNNFVFTSFACLRNALVCLFFVIISVFSPLLVNFTQSC